jgi:hypothetical protein
MPGGKAASLSKDSRFLPRLLSGRDVQESYPAHSLSFSGRKIPSQRGDRYRRDRPLPKLLCANAALIQARHYTQPIACRLASGARIRPRAFASLTQLRQRRAKPLISADEASLPFSSPRMDGS